MIFLHSTVFLTSWQVGLTETKFRKTGAKQEDRKCNTWHFGITVACPQPCKHQTLMHNLWNVWTVSNLRCPRTNTHTLPAVPWGTEGKAGQLSRGFLWQILILFPGCAAKTLPRQTTKITVTISQLPARGNESLDMSQCGGYFCPQWGDKCRRSKCRTLPWRCVRVGMCQDAADYRNKSV